MTGIDELVHFLLEEFRKEGLTVPFGTAYRIAENLIANGVTIPVRCRDCKWWKNDECRNINGASGDVWNGDWFCRSGERKT